MDIINSLLDFINIDTINNVIFIEEFGVLDTINNFFKEAVGTVSNVLLAVASPLIIIILLLLLPIIMLILFKMLIRGWGFYRTFKMIKNKFSGGKNQKQIPNQNTIKNKMMEK